MISLLRTMRAVLGFLLLMPAHLSAADARLVLFASPEGIKRLSSSGAKVDFFDLANQFESQSNAFVCGPTSATIVLNALFHGVPGAFPRDRSRVERYNLSFVPKGAEPTLARFTQEYVIAGSPKPADEIFGKPVSMEGKMTSDFGLQLRQLEALLKKFGAKTKMVIATDDIQEEVMTKDLVTNLKTKGDYVIINYYREAVGQQDGGHISPLAAYDKGSDSFLVLDVYTEEYQWVWIPRPLLLKSLKTKDMVENRGYILVSRS